MPNVIASMFCTLTVVVCAHKSAPPPPPAKGSTQAWAANGMQAVAKAQHPSKAGTRAKNVILFVGEGMGVTTVTAAHILQAQAHPGEGPNPPTGEENLLSFETFPSIGLSKTYTVDLQTAESAGAMSAIMTGVKTNGASVAVGPSVKVGECKQVAAPTSGAHPAKGAAPPPMIVEGQVPTLLEQAKDAGLSAGLVTTSRVTQSAAAATYAHASDRNWEFATPPPPDNTTGACRDIARQLVEFDHRGGLDVVLGGGRLYFLPKNVIDVGDRHSKGLRADGRNLIETWQLLYPRGRYISNESQFNTVDWKTERPVLGLFTPDRMAFRADPARLKESGGEPSLTDMTRAAITALRQNKRGYVLVVIAEGIDAGHQAGNAYRALTETIELSNAVQAARSMTSANDTLIVVTADQGSTLTIAGYPKRDNPILGLAMGADGQPLTDALGQPYTTLGYANGPGYLGASVQQPAGAKRYPNRGFEAVPTFEGRILLSEAPIANPDYRPLLSEVKPQDPNFLQAATVPLPAQTHGGEDVPIYALGPGSQWFHGVMEQNVVYWTMRAALPALPKVAPQ